MKKYLFDLIEKYRAKTWEMLQQFIFNSKALNHNLTLAEKGISNNEYIFVVITKGIKGANNFKFY